MKLPFFEINNGYLDIFRVCLIVSGVQCISVITFVKAGVDTDSGIIDENSILYDYKR